MDPFVLKSTLAAQDLLRSRVVPPAPVDGTRVFLEALELVRSVVPSSLEVHHREAGQLSFSVRLLGDPGQAVLA